MKKSIISIALTIVMVLLVFSTGFAKTFDVAVLLPGSVEFFSVLRRGLDQAAAEFGLNLIYADAEWDAGRQLSQVENFIVRRVDLILLCAADNMALLPAVTLANEANIPLITFTNTLGTDPMGRLPGVSSHIGRTDIEAGEIQGRIAAELLGDGPADIILIQGSPGTAPQRMREEGFMNIAENYPEWNIIERRPIVGWTKEGTLEFMEAFVRSGRNVDLIACQWWSAAIAAAMVLDEAGITGVYVIGLEYARELVPYIKNAQVHATTYYSIVEEGYKTGETAAKFLRGEPIPDFVGIEQLVVTIDNVDDFEPEM